MTSTPPPVIEQPAPYEVSYGLVTGRVAARTRRIVVRTPGRVLADRPLRGRHFTVRVALPSRETSLSVIAVDARGRRATRTVGHVLGLPRAAAPVRRRAYEDRALAREVRRLTRSFPGTTAVYVQSLTSGAGAAWNARARLPAASTLKLAIAVAVLARSDPTPSPGSYLDGLLRRMLIVSRNDAANTLEVWLAGSTSAGGRSVDALMRSLGLVDSLLYGGYERDPYMRSIPIRVDSQPRWGVGKYTTAWDLASLLRAVWLASGSRGVLHDRQPGFSASDARYLLYLLAHVRDGGKLDRSIGAVPGVRVLHKAGWIGVARHDNGLVFWRGGVFVTSVMTYRPSAADASSDALAGRIARVALARFSTARS